MKLKCECCGIENEFVDGEDAFQKGWDAPPHFTQAVTCDLCPAICVILGKSHKMAHDLWAKEGRPEEFTSLKCGDDEVFGDEAHDKFLESVAELQKKDPEAALKMLLEVAGASREAKQHTKQ